MSKTEKRPATSGSLLMSRKCSSATSITSLKSRPSTRSMFKKEFPPKMHYLLNTLHEVKHPSKPAIVSGKIDREQSKIPYRYLEKMRTENMYSNEKIS